MTLFNCLCIYIRKKKEGKEGGGDGTGQEGRMKGEERERETPQ